MPNRFVGFVALLVAAASWWALLQVTDHVWPEQPGAKLLFFALLFIGVTATAALPLAALNRRLAPAAASRFPWRFLRHSLWVGICLTSWAWLQMLRAWNLWFAVIIALIFVAIEIFVARLRGEQGGTSRRKDTEG
jgi:hypothetical protein